MFTRMKLIFFKIAIGNHIYFHYSFTGFLVDDEEQHEEPSSNVQDMSARSAETIILVFF